MGNAWLNKNEIGDTNGPEFLKAARGYVYHIGLSEEQVAGEVDKNEEAPANVLVLVRTENRGVKRRQTDTIDLKRIKELAALDQQLNNGVVLKWLYIRPESCDLDDIIEQI
ncbi:uncharacterized protein PHALS_06259 [Plasmopara halstedii]|uniref:CRN-like protein n=1 Tax=Plasmopara halstedii TaxID=4781 RepID=A0A0P1B3J5_PLAHL|nr:uncharacterized protein PHALS_06259 [Plasmopara halstedii]CEG48438.1 hypothetical protein PHALS_06259 [Plasmopara halstedii]|eukprot:XP_024584807.1 hypothetical protein PHALS_06259 [Plasmopara halstedii]